jgi:CHAD domain-containing protein
VDQLREEIGRAGRLLGEVRDLDVLRDTFTAVAEESDLDVASLIAVLGDERAAAFRDLVDAMRGARWRSMLDALEAAAVLPPLGVNVAPVGDARPAARRLLRKAWRRLDRRVAAATTAPSDWHEVRKAAKSVRYAAELLEPLLKSGAPAVARNAARIQGRLGEVQDRIVARSWLLAHANAESIGDVSQELIRCFGDRSSTKPRHWNRMWKHAQRSAAPLMGGSR